MRKMMLAVLVLALPLEVRADVRDRREISPALAGFDSAALARVDSIIRHAVDAGATPGASLVVGRGGQLVRLRGYGRVDWNPASALVTDSTIYDLASLTKAIGTTTTALLYVRDGQLGLDDYVWRHLRFWPKSGKPGQIRVRHLLQHTSGLPAGTALWTKGGTRASRLAQLARLPVLSAPGARREYSDVGMILLGAVLEEVGGRPLDQLVGEHVFNPLGLTETRYNPLAQFEPSRIAPTERHVPVGRVHDDNAAALAGVAGHAGLFGSARDLARFASAMLDAAHARANPLFSDDTFARLLGERAFGRPPGWDVPAGARSAAGDYFSPGSFGHTGFTGTSIWIDPRKDLFVVLLTNRLHPSAANQKHIALRREVHDAVQLALLPHIAWCPRNDLLRGAV